MTPPAAVAIITQACDALAALGSIGSEADGIDELQALEQLKSAASARQARSTAEIQQRRAASETQRGVAKARRCKGLGAEIGLARGDSPARGARHLQLAELLVHDLPNTLAALSDGRIHEEHAQAVVKETAWLTTTMDRRGVDALIADRLGELGPRKLAAEVRAHGQRLDQDAAVARHDKAKSERRVSVRPAPGGMAYLTALLPMNQAVGVYAGLCRDATTIVGTGETADPTDPNETPRTRDQLMADILVQRATGQTTTPAVPAYVNLVMTDTALFGDDETPAWLTGHGPMPASIAKQWLSNPDATVLLRRVFTRPQDHQLVGLESRSRGFPPGLRQMITLRDDTCRAPHCEAPIRDIDHIRPVRDGGKTSWQNSSALCARCNQTKENTGWHHHGDPEHLEITTPTGHTYSTHTGPTPAARPPHTEQSNTGPPDTKHTGSEPPDDQPPPDKPPNTRSNTLNFRQTQYQYTITIAA